MIAIGAMTQTPAHADAVATTLQQAIEHHQSGALPQAQALYRQILQTSPAHPDALHLLGLIEHQLGNSSVGVDLITKAMVANPAEAMYPFNLGNMHMDLGQADQAITCYQKTVTLQPKSEEALQGLAAALRVKKRMPEAAKCEQKIADLRRQNASALMRQGNALVEQKQFDQAATSFWQVLQIQPQYAEASFNLATVLQLQGKPAEAVAFYRRAISIKPGYADAHSNLGCALKSLGRLDQAVESFRQALILKPNLFEAHNTLGNTLALQGKLDDAVKSYRKALRLQPDAVNTLIDLATALGTLGHIDESVRVFRQALAFDTERSADTYSAMLFTMLLHHQCSADELFSEHQRYAARFETPFKSQWQPHANNRDPDRRLKIGYVSGDFCGHAVWYFIAPVLPHHDKAAFEIYGYYNNKYRDGYTDRIEACVDHWCDCHALTDAQFSDRIRADGIDILVDLSGHTAHHRLLTFARKPAPVQVTWIGYPGSTGLTSIDYRITDPWQDPPGLAERFHSEKVVWLPGGMAFQSEPDCPAINDLPALTSGQFVLACLNNLNKINDAVIALWSKILTALPQSRLLLGNVKEGPVKDRIIDRFASCGIAATRLILKPRVSLLDYLALHHQIDLALDPFPYNGGTTTMHSLWMGVPVVTLEGDHAVARLSAAHLSRVGLAQFISHSEDEYVQCVLRAAQDLPALNQVRLSLRQRMTTGECDPAVITRHLESRYRAMWHTWCQQASTA